MFNLFKKPKVKSKLDSEFAYNPFDDLQEILRSKGVTELKYGDFLVTKTYNDSMNIKFKEVLIWSWTGWDMEMQYKIISPEAVEYLGKILKLEIEKIRLEASLISKKKEVEKLIQDLKDKETLIIFS